MLPLLLLVPISQWYQDIWCQKQNLCEVQVLSPLLKLPGVLGADSWVPCG